MATALTETRMIADRADDELEVDMIVGIRRKSESHTLSHDIRGLNLAGDVEYKVRWKNYPSADDTWEPEWKLSAAKDVLNDFKIKFFTEMFASMQGAYAGITLLNQNLIESHEAALRKGRGYKNGYHWILNKNIRLRDQIFVCKLLATLEHRVESLINIQDLPEIPVCTTAKMSPAERAEIFEASYEGDMCACEVCLRNKVTLKDVMEQNTAMRMKLGRTAGRTFEFARHDMPGLSFVHREDDADAPGPMPPRAAVDSVRHFFIRDHNKPSDLHC
jgi:hypothetical protein